MAKKVRSARGVVVDFDLLKVKQQIAESPSIDVTPRENFVEKRLRRRTKRTATPAKPIAVEPPSEQLDFTDPVMPEEADQEEAPTKTSTARQTKPIRKNA